MARTRQIKPGFFLNTELSNIDATGRLLFIGLWTLADRDGRFEINPKKLKAQIFPYDEHLTSTVLIRYLHQLSTLGFLIVYKMDNKIYGEVQNFAKHQHCHKDEKPLDFPSPDRCEVIVDVELTISHHCSTVPAPCQHHADTVPIRLLSSNSNPNTSNNNLKAPRVFDDAVVDLSELLRDKILENNPQIKHPKVRGESWFDRTCEDINRAIHIDKRTPEQLRIMISWCQNDNIPDSNGFCWANNILSGAKLREKYDKMLMKVRSQHGGERWSAYECLFINE